MARIGFVGCGAMMAEHARRLVNLEPVQAVGHVDIDAARAGAAAERFGGKAYESPEAMYDGAKPDAVYVCVPPHAHGDIEETAIARGIHLFVEKPISLEVATAKKIASLVRKQKVHVCVGYQNRYLESAALARKLLRGKAITLITGCWKGGMPSAGWWRKAGEGGGQIIEQSTHLFDLLRYLCGEVAEVHALASRGAMTHVKGFDVEESSVVAMQLKNGASGCIASTCVAPHAAKVMLEICTPEATFRIENGTLRMCEDGKTTEYHSRVDPLAEQASAFLDTIGNGARGRIRSTYRDALKTLTLTRAATESIESGLAVKPR